MEIKNSEPISELIRESQTFEQDIITNLKKSKKIAWLVTGGSALCYTSR